MVRLRFTLLLNASWTVDVLRVPVGPPACEARDRVTLPWNKFRLSKFSTIVEFEPAGRLAEFGVAVQLKSVAARASRDWWERVPSLAGTGPSEAHPGRLAGRHRLTG